MERIALGALLLAAACSSSPPYSPRAIVPPPLPQPVQIVRRPPAAVDEEVTQRWLAEEIARRRGAAPAPAPEVEVAPEPAGPEVAGPEATVTGGQGTSEDATNAWLQRTIEERRRAAPDEPPVPLQVERTVYVDRPVYGYGGPGYGYDAWGEPVYHAYDRGYETPFPVNTLVGAGIGAAFSGCGDHGEGAAIGAGIGLMFDLARWSH